MNEDEVIVEIDGKLVKGRWKGEVIELLEAPEKFITARRDIIIYEKGKQPVEILSAKIVNGKVIMVDSGFFTDLGR